MPALVQQHEILSTLQVLPISDLSYKEAVAALLKIRNISYPNGVPENLKNPAACSNDLKACKRAVHLTGGRLSYLSKVARAPCMEEATLQMIENEKTWILDHIGLIPDLDDDVMDEVSLQEKNSSMGNNMKNVSKNGAAALGFYLKSLSICG
jgi:hypothetical protein